jgi:hypothetical protein
MKKQSGKRVKPTKRIRVEWNGCGEWIRFWYEEKQYLVPQDLIDAVKRQGVSDYKTSVQAAIDGDDWI